MTKAVEEAGNDAKESEVRDEHNNRFIKNLICTEDDSLFADWNMHYCRLTTKHIEDAEYEWFQENQLLSFPDAPSIGNNNENSTARNDGNSIANDDTISTAPNQEVTTITEDKAYDKMSPKRGKFRKESYKHMIK